MPQLPKGKVGTRIAFIGPMATGKTWCADQLVKYRYYTKVSLAAKLKAIAYELYGVQGKDGNDRLLLQGLGTDLRKYDSEVWIKYLLNYLQKELKAYSQMKNTGRFVVDDVRYQNEALVLKQNGFVLIRVATPENILSGRLSRLYPNRPAEAALHASETEQTGIVADHTFNNDEQLSSYRLMELLDQIVGA